MIIVQLTNYFFCVDVLYRAEGLGDVKLLVIENTQTGLVQFLMENSGLVTEVHMTKLVAAEDPKLF